MCFKSRQSIKGRQSIVTHQRDSDTMAMLPLRCPNYAEEGAPGLQLRLQMQLQRSLRLIAVSLVLLLLVALAALVLLLFGSLLGRGELPAVPNALTVSEPVSEKLQSEKPLSHPSARLTIKEEEEVEEDSPPGLQCQDAVGYTHLRGGMTYKAGILTVPTKGLYRLYLQITYQFTPDKKINDSDMCANDYLDLKITVKHFSKNYKSFSPLLESLETMSCEHDWAKTMFTSGTFDLEAQSQIQIEFTHQELIKTDEKNSFFGAELISNS